MVAVVNGYPIRTVGTDMRSKYPNVCVTLIGEDENAFAIVERVQRALREAGVPTAEVKAFTVEACSGDSTTCWRPSCGRLNHMSKREREEYKH